MIYIENSVLQKWMDLITIFLFRDKQTTNRLIQNFYLLELITLAKVKKGLILL